MTAPGPTPAWVRNVTVTAVSVVAAVAAIASYVHMHELADKAGEEWRAHLIPLSVDGMLVAASMVMLVRRRAGEKAGALPWLGLILGLIASLAANVAAAKPTPLSWIVSGWPPLALAISFELLILVTRDRTDETAGSAGKNAAAPPAVEAPHDDEDQTDGEPALAEPPDWWADAPTQQPAAGEIAEQAEQIAAAEDLPAARALSAVPDPTPAITPAIEELARKARVDVELAAQVEAYLAQVAAQGDPAPTRRTVSQALGLGDDHYGVRKVMEARAA